MEAIDGGNVREDACRDFWRDPCFCQPGTENLGIEKRTMVTEYGPLCTVMQGGHWAGPCLMLS